MVAKHPEVAAKLQKELAGTSPTIESPYLAAIIQETARLFPVGGVMTSVRKTGKDILISSQRNSNMVLPKGSAVIVPSILMGRNPSTFHNPGAFIPERWENATKDMANSVMMFSVGSRRCPGEPLASAQSYFILHKIFSSYKFEVEHNGTFKHNGLASAFYDVSLRVTDNRIEQESEDSHVAIEGSY